jgi:hypothetical protein
LATEHCGEELAGTKALRQEGGSQGREDPETGSLGGRKRCQVGDKRQSEDSSMPCPEKRVLLQARSATDLNPVGPEPGWSLPFTHEELHKY